MSNDATNRQVVQIAKAVSAAFAASSLPASILRDPKIELTDLPWQLPPLQTNLSLQGYDLEHLLSVRVTVTPEKLYHFWRETMHNLSHRPSYAIYKGQYRNLGSLMPTAKAGVRSTLFARYDAEDETAGLMFTLEVANLVMKNLPLADMLSDHSNYWVKTISGHVFGVRDGLPIVGQEDWTFDGSGMIQAMLESQRGVTTTTCLYDTIALARSVLHAHRDEFRKDFLPLDYALQALRTLTIGRACPALIKSMQETHIDRQLWVNKVVALTEATEIMNVNIPDRDRLATLETLLIPLWFNKTEFKRRIFSGKAYPYMIEPSKVEAIKSTLEQLWHDVPEAMK